MTGEYEVQRNATAVNACENWCGDRCSLIALFTMLTVNTCENRCGDRCNKSVAFRANAVNTRRNWCGDRLPSHPTAQSILVKIGVVTGTNT